MLTNSFKNDAFYFHTKLKKKENFSLARYGDGEYSILRNKALATQDDWKFTPEEDQAAQQLLMESFLYAHKDYYVGISCPCCQPQAHIDWMRENAGTKNLTWANIFVNSNFDFYKKSIIPLFKERPVHLIANTNGKTENLPFEIKAFYGIGTHAMRDELNVISELEEVAKNVENELFLFCAGPLANILVHRLHIQNPNNTYLDIGSTLNNYLFPHDPRRDYLQKFSFLQRLLGRGSAFRNRVCIW